MDWFLYDNGLRHERVNTIRNLIFHNQKKNVIVMIIGTYTIFKIIKHSKIP